MKLTLEQKRNWLCLQTALAEVDGGLKALFALLMYGTNAYLQLTDAEVEACYFEQEYEAGEYFNADNLALLKEYGYAEVIFNKNAE